MRFLPGNAQHVGARASQQDAFAFSDPDDTAFVAHGGMVAIVADGMGGMAHGRAASLAATRAFLAAYAAKTAAEPVPQALRRSLHAANQAVLELASHAGAVGEMGTTLAAVALCGDGYYLISVGDSAAYLLRRGRLYQLTRPHTHGDDLDLDAAKRLISEEEAADDPERHALTSFLGIERLVDVDAIEDPRPLQIGDRILVCSDGLSKVLDEKRIAAGLAGDAQEAAERLVEQALLMQRPDQDNVTVLVVVCEDEKALEEAALRPAAAGGPAARGSVPWPEYRSQSALPGFKVLVPVVLALIVLAWLLAQLACPTAPPEAPPDAPASGSPAAGSDQEAPGSESEGSGEGVSEDLGDRNVVFEVILERV